MRPSDPDIQSLKGERKPALDYDKTQMAATYDQARSHSPDVLRLWLERILTLVPREAVSEIVDLGCGTGRFSVALAEAFDARVIGIDPSETMLAQAADKARGQPVTLLHGTGEAMPLPDDSADLVFLSMIFHHLKDPDQVARECHRVLRRGGRVVLRNAMLEELGSNPHTAHFPNYRTVATPHLPPRDRVTAIFEAAGFKVTGHEVVPSNMAPSWPDCARRAASRADSFLARLTDADFQAGLAAIQRHAAQADPQEPVTVNVDLFAFKRL